MPLFPKIASPCPYKGALADIMDGETCRLCQREVYDLTDMDDGARAAFLAACSGETCVTYRAPKNAIFATAAALATMALPLAAVATADRLHAFQLTAGWQEGAIPPLTPADINDAGYSTMTGMVVAAEPDPPMLKLLKQMETDAARETVPVKKRAARAKRVA